MNIMTSNTLCNDSHFRNSLLGTVLSAIAFLAFSDAFAQSDSYQMAQLDNSIQMEQAGSMQVPATPDKITKSSTATNDSDLLKEINEQVKHCWTPNLDNLGQNST